MHFWFQMDNLIKYAQFGCFSGHVGYFRVVCRDLSQLLPRLGLFFVCNTDCISLVSGYRLRYFVLCIWPETNIPWKNLTFNFPEFLAYICFYAHIFQVLFPCCSTQGQVPYGKIGLANHGKLGHALTMYFTTITRLLSF